MRAADRPEEVEALDRRYREACQKAEERSCRAVLAEFEEALLSSEAVMAVSLDLVDKMLASGNELLTTYYQLVGAESRLPGDEWDAQRRLADEALFPGYKEKIRFAALSLTGIGLPSYGDCYLVLRDTMIAHRATVFAENSLLFAEEHGYRIPVGYRAPWKERAKVAVAKLAEALEPDTPVERFPSILMTAGPSKLTDRFVEVHIWGPMSIGSISRIVLPRGHGSGVIRRALRRRFFQSGISVELEA